MITTVNGKEYKITQRHNAYHHGYLSAKTLKALRAKITRLNNSLKSRGI